MSTREAAFTLLPVVLFASWPALARFAQAHRGAPVAEWSVAARSQLERLGAHTPRGASFGELLRALWAVTARAARAHAA